MINLHNKNCFEIIESLGQFDLMILDHLFQDWNKINFKLSENIICFFNQIKTYCRRNIWKTKNRIGMASLPDLQVG